MATVLVGFPLLDLLTQVLPSDVSDPLWRSQATARLGDGLLPMLSGLFIAFAVALLSRHRRTLRVLSVVLAAAAVVCATSLVIWAFNYWDVRSLLTPEEAFTFGETSFVITMKHLAALLLLCTLAAIAWEASPRAWRRRGRPRRPLVDVFARSGPEAEEAEADGPEVGELFDAGSDGVEGGELVDARSDGAEIGELFDAESDGAELEELVEVRSVRAEPDGGPAIAVQPRGVVDTGGPVTKRRRPGRDPETGEEIPAPPDDVLRSEVQALVDAGESLTGARRIVGRKYGIGVTTVRNRTK